VQTKGFTSFPMGNLESPRQDKGNERKVVFEGLGQGKAEAVRVFK